AGRARRASPADEHFPRQMAPVPVRARPWIGHSGTGWKNPHRDRKDCLTTSGSVLKLVDFPDPWGHSSAGRAPAWHAGGRRFDPAWLHHFKWFFVTRLSESSRPTVRKTTASPSSRGLGHNPFTVATGVRIPVGTPLYTRRRVAERRPFLLDAGSLNACCTTAFTCSVGGFPGTPAHRVEATSSRTGIREGQPPAIAL